MTNAIKVLLQMQSGFLQLESTLITAVTAKQKNWLKVPASNHINQKVPEDIADSSCKKPLVICNSIFQCF
jgi:hypothetical protein